MYSPMRLLETYKGNILSVLHFLAILTYLSVTLLKYGEYFIYPRYWTTSTSLQTSLLKTYPFHNRMSCDIGKNCTP